MTYKIYFSNQGVPATGLTPTWSSLKKVADNTDYTQPTISEIGGGWYKFSMAVAEDLVGVIDGGTSLSNIDRYISVSMTPNDANLDSPITGVPSLVWFYTQRTLTDFGSLVSNIWSHELRTLTSRFILKKNTPFPNFTFFLASASDHMSPAIEKSVTAQRSIDGGAFAPCSNFVTEVGRGYYKIDLSQNDLNGNMINFEFSAPGADITRITIITQE